MNTNIYDIDHVSEVWCGVIDIVITDGHMAQP